MEVSEQPITIDDSNLQQKADHIALSREEDALSMSTISEQQLRQFQQNVFYTHGVRHHFLRHEEIL